MPRYLSLVVVNMNVTVYCQPPQLRCGGVRLFTPHASIICFVWCCIYKNECDSSWILILRPRACYNFVLRIYF